MSHLTKESQEIPKTPVKPKDKRRVQIRVKSLRQTREKIGG
jgi:hypothetical protein